MKRHLLPDSTWYQYFSAGPADKGKRDFASVGRRAYSGISSSEVLLLTIPEADLGSGSGSLLCCRYRFHLLSKNSCFPSCRMIPCSSMRPTPLLQKRQRLEENLQLPKKGGCYSRSISEATVPRMRSVALSWEGCFRCTWFGRLKKSQSDAKELRPVGRSHRTHKRPRRLCGWQSQSRQGLHQEIVCRFGRCRAPASKRGKAMVMCRMDEIFVSSQLQVQYENLTAGFHL